jgi:hypothetical protein
MIGAGIAVYIAIGCVVVIIGPGAKMISEQIVGARVTPLTTAITGHKPVPENKLIAFRLLLSLVFVILWPLLLTTSFRHMREREYKDIESRHAEGIEFSRMGGRGTIHCTECNFSEDITSFMHGMTDSGENCCTTGFQCLSCGKFLAIYSEEAKLSNALTRCECGAEIARDHILFCPRCRSKKLQYHLSVIS